MSESECDGDVDGFRRIEQNFKLVEACDDDGVPKKYETLVVTCDSPPGDNRPFAKVTINGDELKGLLDSGASVTILGKGGYKLVEKWRLKIFPVNVRISTADGTEQNVKHFAKVPFSYNGKTKIISTLLIESVKRELILGYDFWRTFKISLCREHKNECNECYEYCDAIIHDPEPPKTQNIFEEHELTDEQKTKLEYIVKSFPFVNENGALNFTKLTKHIIDTADATPIKQKQYIFSPFMQGKIQIEINRLMDRDIIQKVSAPTWLNPIRPVPKSDDKIRLCLDARRLNKVTKKNVYPQQNVNRILSRLEGTKYLTALDLTDAFYQIKLEKESRIKTAFAIPGVGTFMYKRMPMGLVNSGATLSELIDGLFGPEFEPECFPYLDDFILATKTFERHLEILERVAKRLTEAGLVISAKKSKFCMKRLKYLGHLIDENGIQPDPEKIAPISDYPIPNNVKEVRRFIGLTGWYRRFIYNFSDITVPITDLIKKKTKKSEFEWNQKAQEAFETLKRALISAPILSLPDYSQPFVIQTDASDVGIGGVLTQNIENVEKVIAYMSSKLTRTQQKYHVTERECLAVLTAVEKFRPFIEGTRFTVITDHASLQWLQNLKDPMGRLARWALRLQAFDFELIHRKGKLNVVPDAMSRAFRVELLKVASTFKTEDKWYDTIRIGCSKNGTYGDNYRKENDNIYVFVRKGLNEAQKGWKICVPTERSQEIISRYHDAVKAAHGGIGKTLNRIREMYYWPKMASDIENYVKGCSVCKQTKPTNMNQNAMMGNFRDPKSPFRMMALDFVGPLPMTKLGNRFMLVVVDLFSKYVFVKPLKHQSANHTINYLKDEIFLKFGVPEILISDNGPQLRSETFREFLKENKIKHWLTAVYHPQSNPTEAVNKTLVTAIRAYTNDDLPHDAWDRNLNEIVYALNSATHTSTSVSPHMVVFGRKLTEDGDEYVTQNEENVDEKKRKTIYEKVAAYLKAAYENNKKRYDLRSREITYEPNELIYRRNTKLSNAADKYSAKLADKFIKAQIVKRVGTNTYEVKDIESKHVAVYHTKMLKKQ